MMNVEISVIVPVYNVEDYLDECIQSILKQTFDNFELILIDDGSTDNSGFICDKYKQIDARVKVKHQDNRGQSSARNAGLDCAYGKYITFIDSDDWIEPKYLEFLYNKIKIGGVDIVRGAFRKNGLNINESIFHPNIENEIVIKNTEYELIHLYFSGKIMPMMTAGLYDSDLFLDVRFPEHLCAEDIYVTFMSLYYSKGIMITNQVIYNMRVNVNSVTHTKIRNMDICNTWKYIRDFAVSKELPIDIIGKIDGILARLLYHFIRDAKKDGIRVVSAHKSVLSFISRNLNFIRRMLFDILLIKNNVKILDNYK